MCSKLRMLNPSQLTTLPIERNLLLSSGMSEDEVREEFSTFLEQHPDGKIHKREFKEMLEKVGSLVVLLISAFLSGTQTLGIPRHLSLLRRCLDKTQPACRSTSSDATTRTRMATLTLSSSW